MLLWATLLALATPARAADILIPEATPGKADDFAVAYMVYDMVASELRDTRLQVSDGDDIASWAGSDGEGCFGNSGCPANLWGRTDARYALVLSVTQGAGSITVKARLYGRTRATAVQTYEEVVPEGGEAGFARAIAEQVASYIQDASLPADEEEVVAAAPAATSTTKDTSAKDTSASTAKTSTTKDTSTKDTSTKDTSAKDTSAKDTKSSTGTTKDTSASTAKSSTTSTKSSTTSTKSSTSSTTASTPGTLSPTQETERRKMGIPKKAYQRYLASKQKQADWLADHRVRAGRLHLDANAGVGLGDVDRGYGVWAHVVNDAGEVAVDATSTWQGDARSVGAYGTLGIGFTPLWWLDLQLTGGVQQGRKLLETGWECPDCNPETQLVQTIYQPRLATELLLEPRVRVPLAATGVVKPFLEGGAQLRVFDGFQVPTDAVPFPSTTGGVGLGVTGGAGATFDLTPGFGLTLEVPYTLTLTPKASSTDADSITSQPTELESWGGTLRVILGGSLVF